MNDILRISPSVLDGFRYYVNHGNCLEEYVESLKKTGYLSFKPDVGTYLHAVLESSSIVGDSLSLLIKDSNTEVCIDVSCLMEKPTVSELKAIKRIEVDGHRVDMVGKADAIFGNMGKDYKFTFSSLTTDRFFESIQWKFYMLLFNIELFRYIIFRCKGDEKKVSVYEIEHFDIYRNVYVESDVYDIVSQFIYFINKNNIYRYFVMGTDEYRSKYAKK